MSADNQQAYAGRDLEALSDLPNYYGWIVGQFAPCLRGDAIELGAGVGTVSARLLPHLDSLEVVEPSPNLLEPLRQRFAGEARVRISPQTLEARLADAESEQFDTVVMVNVLEHIADDADALAKLHRILRPGGHILLFVPALPALYSAFDREVGHFRRYRRAGLHDRLVNSGFDILHLAYMDLLGVIPWWLFQTMGGSKDINPKMAQIYDRVGIPVTRAVERCLDPPIGKNLIAIGRRN